MNVTRSKPQFLAYLLCCSRTILHKLGMTGQPKAMKGCSSGVVLGHACMKGTDSSVFAVLH